MPPDTLSALNWVHICGVQFKVNVYIWLYLRKLFKISPVLLIAFQKIKEEEKLPNAFHDASIMLILKSDRIVLEKKSTVQCF